MSVGWWRSQPTLCMCYPRRKSGRGHYPLSPQAVVLVVHATPPYVRGGFASPLPFGPASWSLHTWLLGQTCSGGQEPPISRGANPLTLRWAHADALSAVVRPWPSTTSPALRLPTLAYMGSWDSPSGTGFPRRLLCVGPLPSSTRTPRHPSPAHAPLAGQQAGLSPGVLLDRLPHSVPVQHRGLYTDRPIRPYTIGRSWRRVLGVARD